jgi:hypothetical protein
MIDDMPKKAVSKKKAKPASARRPERAGSKKVTGTVLKIVNGKPTDEKLSAEKAFDDLEQARAQVLYVEKHGSREEKRLVRLAFRQYQGMRFSRKGGG